MNTSRVSVSACLLFGVLARMAGALNMETVPVGDPGNAADSRYGGYGSVAYPYNIGKHEVTSGQYCEFLNAVAKTDTYGLYDTTMASLSWDGCNIIRTGSSGSYSYSVTADWANRPVNYVGYWDACRFANWLHNGQPTGPQGAGTTETGAYALNGYTGSLGQAIQRNANWNWAVTSEDEWYKAAYYKGGSTNAGYWDYPTATNSTPSNQIINPDPGNNANFWQNAQTIGDPYHRTPVGEFENSASPYGTFDQGGNVMEWNQAIVLQNENTAYRGLRSGAWSFEAYYMRASYRNYNNPNFQVAYLGFRVVQVPEPGSALLFVAAALGALLRRRRR